jgi:hypothetical protein
MLPTRSRVLGVAVAATLMLTLAGLAAPVVAADDPETVVNELFDAVEAGDFAAVESLVCETERAAVREMIDPGAQMGVDASSLAEALTFAVEDRGVTVLSNDGETAIVEVTGTMSMNVDEDDIGELARNLLIADMGEDISAEDLEMMMPFMEMAFSQSLPLDEELTLVVEDGQWLVCGGLGEAPEEPDYGFELQISSEGVCALASPDELSALGTLEYDSSIGFETFCTYSSSDWESYHSTSVSLELDRDAENVAAAYGADQRLEVGGAPAWAPGPEGFGTNLITQVGSDMLVVTVAPPETPPEGFDWLTQATLVTELVMPRIADARVELAGPTPGPTPVPTPEISLCEALTLEELNAATGLGFDEASGDSSYCGYSSFDGEPGFHNVSTSLLELSLEDYATWIPELEEATVADLRALVTANQLVVELPGAAYLLTVSGFVDNADESATLTTPEALRLVAEMALPGITAPTPTSTEDIDAEAPAESLEDPEPALLQDDYPALAGAMCDYLDLDAVNGLGLLAFDTENSFYDEHCWLSQQDLAGGYSELSAMLDIFGIAEMRDAAPGGTDLTVAGRPAYLSELGLQVETSAGPVAFSALLGNEVLDAGLTAADLMVPVAELVVTALEAEVGGE